MDIKDLTNKKIAIIGFGHEGQAVFDYLVKNGMEPVIFDSKYKTIKKEAGVKILGSNFFSSIKEYDVIFRSPGVNPDSQFIQDAKKAKKIITSQTQWFFDHCPARIIAVTGSKGKTTTSNVIYRILNKLSDKGKVFLTGNIGGNSPFKILDKLSKDDLVVFELSSFQLIDSTIKPFISVLLRVEAEHLDYHGNLKNYLNAKKRITASQDSKDYCVYLEQYPLTKKLADTSKAILIPVKDQGDKLKLKLIGTHNKLNVAAAIEACFLLGINREDSTKVVANIKPVEHRLELFLSIDGIKFYDDSLATNPFSTIESIRSLAESQLIVILGGVGNKIDFKPLITELKNTKNIKAVICMGTSGELIYKTLQNSNIPSFNVSKNFKKVFKILKKLAIAGDSVLLSPADKSFDMFKSAKERGLIFKQYATEAYRE